VVNRREKEGVRIGETELPSTLEKRKRQTVCRLGEKKAFNGGMGAVHLSKRRKRGKQSGSLAARYAIRSLVKEKKEGLRQGNDA